VHNIIAITVEILVNIKQGIDGWLVLPTNRIEIPYPADPNVSMAQ
jgi:hypothetical protein